MRIAIYARVSTRDKGQDVENQLRELRQFAERSGWTVVAEYTDQASGKHADREQLQAMFADAGRRKFDALLIWALDRLTREGVAQTFAHIRRLLDCGVQFISYTEAHFRTIGPAGELMIAIAAWIAEQERIRISERVKAGLQTARGKGKKLGRRPVAVRLEYARELRAAGRSYREIAAELGIAPMTAHKLLSAPAISST